MRPSPDVSDPIATSEGTATSRDGAVRAIRITIGRPFQPSGPELTWYCAYRMELGGEVHRESSGAGTDGIEALTTTLVMLAGLVGYLRKEFVVEFNGWPEFAPEAFLRKVELGSS